MKRFIEYQIALEGITEEMLLEQSIKDIAESFYHNKDYGVDYYGVNREGFVVVCGKIVSSTAANNKYILGQLKSELKNKFNISKVTVPYLAKGDTLF